MTAPHYETLPALLVPFRHLSASNKVGARSDGECPLGVFATFNWGEWRWAVYNDCPVGRLRTLGLAMTRPGGVHMAVTPHRVRLAIASEMGRPRRGLHVWRVGRALPAPVAV